MRIIATLGLLASTAAAAAPVEVMTSQGSSMFPDLERALTHIPDGATLTLLPGDHGDITLDGGVEVRVIAAEGAQVHSLTVGGSQTVAEVTGLAISNVDRAINVLSGTLLLSKSELRNVGSSNGYAMRVAPGAAAGLVHVGIFDSKGDRGVIRAEDGSSLGIVNSFFEGNSATTGGVIFGAHADIGIRGSAFHKNTATDAGGAIAITGGSLDIATVEIRDCEAERGAGLYLGPTAALVSADLDLRDNVATTGGHILAVRATAALTRTRLRNGWARRGGGIAAVGAKILLQNALIVGNRAPATGGAFHLDGGDLTLSYATMVGNHAAMGAGIAAQTGAVTIQASILANNEGEAVASAGGHVGIRSTLMEGLSLGGVLAGNVSLDGSAIDGVPGFVDAQGGDFALTTVSDALDAGHAGTADLDGTPADWGMYGGDEAWELADLDGDGFVHGRDCDDTDRNIHELGKEVWYDGIDTNCDGADDFDQDGDGEQAMQSGGTDCVDTDPEISRSATEREGDKIDADCDGLADPDADDDGWPSSLDCDDSDATTHPGAADRFYDGRDQDCDGRSDYDADGDGYDSARHGGADCDDSDAFVSPATPEILGDDIDQDCDGGDDAPVPEREPATVQGHGVDDAAGAPTAFPTPPARGATTTGCASTGAAPLGGLLSLLPALSALVGRRRGDDATGP